MRLRPLPEPMLARPGDLSRRGDYAFEVKWDGFRAIVSTEDRFEIRSRRGWSMTELLPELAGLPAGPFSTENWWRSAATAGRVSRCSRRACCIDAERSR
jgi:ATP-dependent DNA ligase